jgi:hypothetical protein
MNDAEMTARHNPAIVCNSCKSIFRPYPASFAPTLSEVACPTCGTIKILYYGEDPDVLKMILGSFGVNKELNERLDRLENQIGSMKEMVKTSLDDSRNIMTKALVGAVNEQLRHHEKDFHNYGGSTDGKQKN